MSASSQSDQPHSTAISTIVVRSATPPAAPPAYPSPAPTPESDSVANDSDPDAEWSNSPRMLEYRRTLALYNHRRGIIQDLAAALHSATTRLAHAATGESVFTCNADLTLTLRLLQQLPRVLELLPRNEPNEPQPPQPKEPSTQNRSDNTKDWQPPNVPVCPFCGEGPRVHDFLSCPHKPANYNPWPSDPKTLARANVLAAAVRSHGLWGTPLPPPGPRPPWIAPTDSIAFTESPNESPDPPITPAHSAATPGQSAAPPRIPPPSRRPSRQY